jgi:hypothetical protein
VQAHGGGARDAAQHWKLVLEQRQRKDRALREQAGVVEHGGHGQQHHHRHSTSSTRLGSAEELPGLEKEQAAPTANGSRH